MIRKTTRTIEVYELEGKDLNIVRNAINYAWHRASKHNKDVAGDVFELQRIRKELDII